MASLFGHSRGAFNAALTDTKGRFQVREEATPRTTRIDRALDSRLSRSQTWRQLRSVDGLTTAAIEWGRYGEATSGILREVCAC